MSESASFIEFCQTHDLDRRSLRSACVDLVMEQSGRATLDGVYQTLIERATDSEAVDRLLYQFVGNPDYADTVAGVLLIAAWNDPAQRDELKSLLLAAKDRAVHIDAQQLAIAMIGGLMILLVEGPIDLTEIPYRDETGTWQTLVAEEGVPVIDLLAAVRDVFEG